MYDFREHLEKFLFFTRVNGLYDKLPILGEEKETATLSSRSVLLPLVCFEDLEPVVLGIHGLGNINFINPIHVPQKLKHLRCI